MTRSAFMRALWADPVWRARQRERMQEGWARRIIGRRGVCKAIIRDESARSQATTIVLEIEQVRRLIARAKREGTSLSELVRTYVEWGLEADT